MCAFILQIPMDGPIDNPKLRKHDGVNDGTLFRWAPARSGLSSYENGSVIENLASEEAGEILGVDPSTLHSTFSLNSTATEFLAEKTTKGGLHLMVTQNQLGGARRSRVEMVTPVKTYINTHSEHQYLAVFIGRITRLSTNQQPFFFFGTSAYSANRFWSMQTNPSVAAPGGIYNPGSNPGVGVPFLFTATFSAKTGTWNPTDSFTYGGFFQGAFGSAGNGYASIIMYESAVHDLTVASLTASEQRAIEVDIFNAAFAEGGEFHNDTWTTPTL